MKKKIVYVVLSIIICLICLSCFIACQTVSDDENNKGNDNVPTEYGHEHTFESAWTFDETYHWHKATCEHENEKQGLQEHNYDSEMTCITCGYAKPHTHLLIRISSVEPTCTTAGNMECWQCRECKKYFADVNCSAEITDIEISEMGHTVSGWIVDIESSCLTAGVQHKECEECKTVLQIQNIDKVEHAVSDWIVDVEPSCESEGVRHKECEVCETVLQTQNIERIEHIVSDWIVDAEPSCESEGVQHKECEVCRAILQLQGIEKTEHGFGEWIETKSATCIQEGEETRNCLTCNNYEETRTIAMISHQLKYISDDEIHNMVCSVCLNTVDTGVHTYEDDICTECGWHKSIIFECIAPLDEYTLGQIYTKDDIFDPIYNIWISHEGVDFTASAGSEVKCIFDGVVKEISEDGYSGTTVTIEHVNGYVSIYKYICDTTLQVGDSIAQGDVIGKVSDTALEESAYGPHLHLELLHYGLKINPLDYMPGVDTSSTNINL